MKRFILLTFGFLGWAFYEMSGGSEFESASDRIARLNPAPEVTVTEVQQVTEQPAQTAAQTVIDTDPPASSEVTRVSLNLTNLQDAAEAAPARPVETTRATPSVDPDTGVAVNVGVTLTSADTPAIIPSLIAPNDSGAANVQAAETAAVSTDIRTVSGNRVNVRGGPGTDFGIVGKLVRGDAVEIIEDNGDGWVRMRAVDSEEQGWLADFLLTSG